MCLESLVLFVWIELSFHLHLIYVLLLQPCCTLEWNVLLKCAKTWATIHWTQEPFGPWWPLADSLGGEVVRASMQWWARGEIGDCWSAWGSHQERWAADEKEKRLEQWGLGSARRWGGRREKETATYMGLSSRNPGGMGCEQPSEKGWEGEGVVTRTNDRSGLRTDLHT